MFNVILSVGNVLKFLGNGDFFKRGLKTRNIQNVKYSFMSLTLTSNCVSQHNVLLTSLLNIEATLTFLAITRKKVCCYKKD